MWAYRASACLCIPPTFFFTFYAVRVISEENRRLVLHRTYLYSWILRVISFIWAREVRCSGKSLYWRKSRIPSKRWYIPAKLYGVTCHKTIIIIIDVRTSNLNFLAQDSNPDNFSWYRVCGLSTKIQG
jgi:hypothetical protein